MTIRRTTLAAHSDDIALLEHEARRRGISLAQVLRELVAREAASMRSARRPRFGIGGSGEGLSVMAARDEDAPARDRGVG